MRAPENPVPLITVFIFISLALVSTAQTQLINGRCYLKCKIPLAVEIKCGSNGINYQNKQELLCAKKLCYPGERPSISIPDA